MKKMIMSAGVVAIGALSISSAQAQSKPWSVSASLRGFYDDNYTTLPSTPLPGGATKRSSVGFEISPSLSYNLALDPTVIGFSYTYDMKYYADRRNNSADHSHQAMFKLDHAFSENFKVAVNDTFVIAQEPAVLDPVLITIPIRSDGNNIRNTASVSLTGKLSEHFGLEGSYANSIYDYQQEGLDSRSALLDRTEHLISLNLRWEATPQTVGILGYQFGLVNHTSNDLLSPGVSSKTRDNRSHYLYVGADHNFSSQLSGSVRAGGQFTEYPKAAAGSSKSIVSPYFDLNGSYAYTSGSYVQLGVKHTRNQTDIAAGTLDAESTTVYGSVNHAVTAKINASLLAQYQNSSFNQGVANNKEDNLFMVGVNLGYKINEFLSAEAGYNYDRLSSDLGQRSYYRDRVYIGIKATY